MPSPRYWREIPGRYRLEAGRCHGCGKVVYPTRRICPACRGAEFEPVLLSRRGRVVTSTVLRVSPDDFVMESPYAMAIVETPERVRLMVQVTDCEPSTVQPGMEVTLEFRLIRKEGQSGILCYGHKAVPVVAADTARSR
ncbi:MAG: Zn-ribbon domain-containing OB-fold protein [Planctomycetes bacterium]|nr:Zn-ribbon domain-containing OB-fold protein [Planctomycetota bacterium]